MSVNSLKYRFVYFVLCAISTVNVSGMFNAADDPVEVIVRAYETETAKRTEFDGDYHTRWLTALLKVSRANKNSLYYNGAMMDAVSLTNSVSDFKQSEEIILEVLDVLENVEHRAFWYMELGEIRRERYLQAEGAGKHKEAVKHAKSAFEAFDTLTKFVSQLPAKERSLGMTERCIMASSMAASLAGDALNQPEQALRKYQQGLKLSQGLKAGQGVMGTSELGYDTEHFASSAMRYALRSDNIQDAKSALEIVRQISNGRWPPTYYAWKYSSLAFPRGGDKYQAFVTDWMARQKKDSWTGILYFYSARDYFKRGTLDNAEIIYLRLLGEFSKDILKADEPAIAAGRGGYMAEILDHLTRIYQKTGRAEEAKSLIKDFNKLLPNDPRLERVTGFQASVEKELSRKPKLQKLSTLKPNDSKWKWIIIFINVAIVVALLLFWGVRSLRRRQS